jgi:hypothetical protein
MHAKQMLAILQLSLRPKLVERPDLSVTEAREGDALRVISFSHGHLLSS